MEIHNPGIYHIYNRGNNKQCIFFREENYLYFLRKCHYYIKPISEIIAWCLMPNHFHFLIEVTTSSLSPVQCGGLTMPAISNAFRLLQSAYAKGINKQEGRTGNLFQQKTKSKLVNGQDDYTLTAFAYIHQNPVKAGLVCKLEDWAYSSYPEYLHPFDGQLSNSNACAKLPGFQTRNIKEQMKVLIGEEDANFIFLKVA